MMRRLKNMGTKNNLSRLMLIPLACSLAWMTLTLAAAQQAPKQILDPKEVQENLKDARDAAAGLSGIPVGHFAPPAYQRVAPADAVVPMDQQSSSAKKMEHGIMWYLAKQGCKSFNYSPDNPDSQGDI